MNVIKGKLVRQKNRIMVQLPTKNGTALFPIPELAKRFRDQDVKDDTVADVTRDSVNRIVEVSIPGAAQVAPVVTQPQTNRSKGNFQPLSVRELPKAQPEIIGGPFTNPYTFIPFDKRKFVDGSVRHRIDPTLLSADEISSSELRHTGVLFLKVTTLSPLMTCDPVAKETLSNGHKVLQALTIESDVIVPATGVRGALRTLMTIVTGGTLGYVDPTAYLIQGRDAKLGPATPNDNSGTPPRVFLGEVVQPGSSQRPGKIRLGETELVRTNDLKEAIGQPPWNRKPNAKPIWIGMTSDGRLTKSSPAQSAETPWRLRLSGAPVGGSKMEEKKREGLFRPSDTIIEIASEKWAQYQGRNQGGERSELRKGDLVWLEPTEQVVKSRRDILSDQDIKSLQWSRWGKTGDKLENRIPKHLHPDSWNDDGKVDEVTNLFGQIQDERSNKKAISFASRIRPENLVFEDAATRCMRTVLAPMAMPHPGCLAFYRENDSADNVDFKDWLRGYKVYRTSLETGDQGPWNYAVQGVYDQGKLKQPLQQAVNQTVDLLPVGETGTLRIAFRGLTKRELSILVRMCELPWRLGGGKPLGLGACQTQVQHIIGEDASISSVEDRLGADWRAKISDIEPRIKTWVATQQPVAFMRYPRGIKGNSRGGHAWFTTHAKPRMVSKPDLGEREKGLAPIYMDGKLKEKAAKSTAPFDAVQPMISGQILPPFDADQWQTDLLYGYDMVPITEHGRQNTVTDFQPLEDDASNMGNYDKYSNQSQNRFSREENKKRRGQT